MFLTKKMFKLDSNSLKAAQRAKFRLVQKLRKPTARMTITITPLLQGNDIPFSLLVTRAGMATAALCCAYSIHSIPQELKNDIGKPKSSTAFSPQQAQPSDRSVDKPAIVGAKKDDGRRGATAAVSPSSDERLPIKVVDFSTMTAVKAQSIIKKIHAGSVLDGESLIKLIKACIDVFMQEDTVVDLRECSAEITVVGDLHGSLPCLKRILKLAGNVNEDMVIVVAGDYIDRGEHSLEVLCTLLLLKLVYPKNVVLLRGNHEDIEICSRYGFACELQEKYGFVEFESIWTGLADLFASLPICARTEKALICHGGLPSADFQLSDLEEVSASARFQLKTIVKASDHDGKLLQGILWSDPSTQQGVTPSDRGIGIHFGPDVVKDFLEQHNLRYIFRGHEHVKTGTQVLDCGDGCGVVTVFSTANYSCTEGNNFGAILKLREDGNYTPITFTYTDDKSLDVFKGSDSNETISVDTDKSWIAVEGSFKPPLIETDFEACFSL